MTQLETKDRALLAIAAAMIIPPALMFSCVTDMPHVIVATIAILLASTLKKKPFKYSDRTVIYTILAPLAAAVVTDLALPAPNNRFVIIGVIAKANVSVPFFLYLAAMITFFPSNPYVFGAAAALSLVATIVSGDVMHIEMENITLTFANQWINNMDAFVAAVAAIQTTALVAGIARVRNQRPKQNKTTPGGKLKKRILVAHAAIYAAAIAAAGLFLFHTFEPQIRKIEYFFVNLGIRHLHRSNQIVFGNEVDLNRTLNPQWKAKQHQVVLRAEGEQPPQYLRGRAYCSYNDGRWTNISSDNQKMIVQIENDLVLSKSFFHQIEPPPAKHQFQITPTSIFHSDVLLIPPNATKFNLVADNLHHLGQGVLKPERWQKECGYIAAAVAPQTTPAANIPDKPLTYLHLNRPLQIEPTLRKHLQNAIGNENLETLDDTQIINRICSYLQTHFKYSLEKQPNQQQKDPVENFLEHTKNGHCELFATAAALILRNAGVPARYVTGFVCQELHPSKAYYISRVRDAHAWVEAYSRDKQRWTLVEPTPPTAIARTNQYWSTPETWKDYIAHLARQTLAHLKRGHFAQAAVDVVNAFAKSIAITATDHRLAPFFWIIIAAAAYWIIKKQLGKQKDSFKLNNEKKTMRKLLKKLRDDAEKQLGIKNTPYMTNREWAAKIARANPGANQSLAQFVEHYQQCRFRSQNPTQTQITQAKKYAKDTRQEWK